VTVYIEAYHPVICSLRLYLFGHLLEFALDYEDLALYQITSDTAILKKGFRTYDEAERYCLEMDYSVMSDFQ